MEKDEIPEGGGVDKEALLSNVLENFQSPTRCGPHHRKCFQSSWEQVPATLFSSIDREAHFSPYQQLFDQPGVGGTLGWSRMPPLRGAQLSGTWETSIYSLPLILGLVMRWLKGPLIVSGHKNITLWEFSETVVRIQGMWRHAGSVYSS